MREEARKAGLEVEVDSAGTGSWHIGSPPDPRAIAEARHHGIDIAQYRGRQVGPEDFDRFDHIFALDHENLANLKQLAPPGSRAQLSLLLDLVPELHGQPVADPYFGAPLGFETTWAQVSRAAKHLVTRLQGSR